MEVSYKPHRTSFLPSFLKMPDVPTCLKSSSSLPYFFSPSPYIRTCIFFRKCLGHLIPRVLCSTINKLSLFCVESKGRESGSPYNTPMPTPKVFPVEATACPWSFHCYFLDFPNYICLLRSDTLICRQQFMCEFKLACTHMRSSSFSHTTHA